MKLYFVRHGESTANILKEFSNSGCKHPLTPKGVEQAHKLADSLAGRQFECIYSSPILRAQETAHILAEALQVSVEITGALREWDVGIYEGTNDPTGWEAHSRVQDLWFSRKQLDARMPGGESFRDIQKRFVPFIEGLIQDGRNVNRNFILVGHGGLYIAMLPAILANVDHAFAVQHGFGNAGYVLAESRPGGLYCLSWCGFSVDQQGS